MDMFNEIDKLKVDFPKFKRLNKEIDFKNFNNYQRFAVAIFIIGWLTGIVLGSLFSVCGINSNSYSSCSVKEFNYLVLIIVWSITILLSVFIFWMGHIIKVLKSIDKKLK